MQLIIQSANSYYDLVFIDTAPGQNNSSQTIIQNSDLVVINLSQTQIQLSIF